ncbi:hypothetical protein F4803DRAFT_560524 [Xylaria telfairii]|nr:hypothetical protein F4803DRAFT_560524 [Xylaria telfairii]
MAYYQPLSPWAQRFHHGKEGREAILNDIQQHSNLAPEQPRLHPKYYADKPPPADSARTALQMDHLFSTEKFQRLYLRGFHSWMNGPMMRYVWFSQRIGLVPGGHQADDYGPVRPGDTEVLNLLNPPKHINRAPGTEPTVSVINERPPDLINPPEPVDRANGAYPVIDVEKETREGIALKIFHAERIQVDESKWLSFLKKDRWLEWENPEPILGDGNWSVDNPKVWEILSISIELLDRILKSLIADKHVMLETVLYGLNLAWDQAANSPPPFEGANLLLSVPYLSRICAVGQSASPLDFVAQFTPEDWTTRLEYLLSFQIWSMVEKFNNLDTLWGVTLNGRSNMIVIDVGVLKTLITRDVTLAERCILQLAITTTLVDDDAAAEMGFAAEQRIFGGQLILGLYILGWPSAVETLGRADVISDSPIYRAGRRIHITRVSALFASKLLSAAFWDDATIAQKSANYFHSNRLFTSDTTYPGLNMQVEYNMTALSNDPSFTLENGETEMIAAWLERNRDWAERREGWYENAKMEWQLTPWSDVGSRQVILQFGQGFDERNGVKCRFIAQLLLRRVAWTADRDAYIQGLPPARPTHDWIFHAIGLLMLAALPIDSDELRLRDKYRMKYRFVPSSGTAAALRTPQEVYRSRWKDDRRIPPSLLYDPLGRPGQAVGAADFFQEDLLDVLARLVEFLAYHDVAVPDPWIREIIRTAEDLRQQRRDVGLNARDKLSWAVHWPFVIPTYNTSMSRFRNGRWTVQV